MKRNPDFDGKLVPKHQNDVVTGLGFSTGNVTDISPVLAPTGLRELDIHGAAAQGGGALEDLSPLKGLRLIRLNAGENRVSDLKPLAGMPLENLALWLWRGTDLTPLQGMPLKWLNIGGSRQMLDLSPLAAAPLEYLCVNDTQVSDLTPLKDTPLSMLECSHTLVNDAGLPRANTFKSLTDFSVHHTKVTAAGIGELSKAFPKCKIEWDGPLIDPSAVKPAEDSSVWERTVAIMPAAEQVKAVEARLRELNPGFNGKIFPVIEKETVTSLKVPTLQATNISPVRAFANLHTLDLGDYPGGRSILADISPLCDMPLTSLSIPGTKVKNLIPLKGMQLMYLSAMSIPTTDLSPLQGMPLKRLDLYGVRAVTSLKPVEGMPLDYLNLSHMPLTDLSALKGMTTLRTLVAENMPLADLTPLRELRLDSLKVKGTRVSDFEALKTIPLSHLALDYRPEHKTLLQSLKLTRINDKPAADFWKDVDPQKTPH